MSRGVLIALGLGALLLAAGVAAAPIDVPGSRRARVLERYTAHGVHPDLQWLMDEWELYGPFDITVGNLPGFPGGGLRTDEAGQAAAAGANLSQAATLRNTPHGRGAAVDFWPTDFNPWIPWAAQPASIKIKFLEIGKFAEARGFEWGGRWRSKTFPDGDQPHVEIIGWRMLPFPPPNYGG